MLNVQCLTQVKMIQIQDFVDKSENIHIFCMVETHLTRDSIYRNANIKTISKMRSIKDRKGGGLQILWKENDDLLIEEVKTDAIDLMMINVKLGDIDFSLILVYFSTNDDYRNEKMTKEIKALLRKFENKKVMVIGDFNGHIGIISSQKLNKNGKKTT